MASPFLSNSWMRPKARQAFTSPRAVPVRDLMESFFNHPRKVVSIPVQFAGSDETRSASAMKIQKIFRGFLLRKRLKRVFAIRDEVDDMERMISYESMRGNPKERLRINELLMSFLLKLDSVTGIDACVKDCRKSVIKKIIRLQELVDSITDDFPENLMLRSADHVSGTKDLKERSVDSESNKCVGVQADATDLDDPDSVLREDECEDCIKDVLVDADNRGDGTSDDHVEDLIEGREESNVEMVGIMEERSESEKGSENPDLPADDEEDKKKEVVMERLVDDSKKMMNLMMELCEKNTMQLQMLQSLSQRVDKLERAIQCETSRKKKKPPKDSAEG